MSKVDRTKLPRGAKLLTEHIATPLQNMQNQITGTGANGFGAEQVEAGYAPFRINLSVPYFDLFSAGSPVIRHDAGGLAIPFMLPPLQEDLDFVANATAGNTPRVSDTLPPIILDEVSLSFDTRCEPADIVSNWYQWSQQGKDPNEGKLSYEAGAFPRDISMAILERKPTWGQSAPTDFTPTRTIWSGSISASVELSSPYMRTGNPFVAADIRQALDPYKSYILELGYLSYIHNLLAQMALVSVEISMKFLSPLRLRDSGANIQNIPTRHLGERNKHNTYTSTGAGQHSSTSRALMGASPAAGDPIEANTATGVQTFMAVIDEFFRSKLRGGYDMHSDVPNLESVNESAAYTVLSVPLFNNTIYGGVSLPTPVGAPWGYPYVDSTAGKFIDRRFIPIAAPMTIHHVLFTWSWLPFYVPDGAVAWRYVNKMPAGVAANQSLRMEIGVGMGTGARADMFGYEQIAQKSLTDVPSAAWAGEAIDLIDPDGNQSSSIGGNPSPYQLEMHSMDLEGSGRPGLNGMTAQGYPIFVGQSRAGRGPALLSQRTGMQGTGAPPETLGAEQWLEVRAKVYDADGSGVDWATGWDADQMIVGAKGIWVYIIGKTHLV